MPSVIALLERREARAGGAGCLAGDTARGSGACRCRAGTAGSRADRAEEILLALAEEGESGA